MLRARLPTELRREPEDASPLGPAILAVAEVRVAAARLHLHERRHPERFSVSGIAAGIVRATRFVP